MANAVYPKALEGFLGGDIAWDSDSILVSAQPAGYVYSAAHDFANDLAAAIATSSALGSKTITNGVADAADKTFSAVAAGSTITSLVVYQDTGNVATSRLIAYFDTKADTTPISVATNGGDVVVTWNASGIFSI